MDGLHGDQRFYPWTSAAVDSTSRAIEFEFKNWREDAVVTVMQCQHIGSDDRYNYAVVTVNRYNVLTLHLALYCRRLNFKNLNKFFKSVGRPT